MRRKTEDIRDIIKSETIDLEDSKLPFIQKLLINQAKMYRNILNVHICKAL